MAEGLPDFGDRDAALAWLRTQPREVSVVIAARAALRVAPLLRSAQHLDEEARRGAIVSPVFRALSTSWLVWGLAKEDVLSAANAAAYVADADAACAAAYAASSAAAADAAPYDAAASAHAAVSDAANASANIADPNAAAAADATLVNSGATALDLAARPLWLEGAPNWATDEWGVLKTKLLAADEGWEVWTDWYDARLRGDPYDLALVEKRALIPEEIWEQGPKVVNAEIARIIAEHAARRAPEVPDERPTPVSFTAEDGVLRPLPAPGPSPEPADAAMLRAAHRALAEMLDDFVSGGAGGQNKQIATALGRCGGALGQSLSDLNVILLGMHATTVANLAARAEEMLLAEDAAQFAAINAQLALFLGWFPEWSRYLAGQIERMAAPEAEQQAVSTAGEAIKAICDAAPEIISAEAAEALAPLLDPPPSPTPDTPSPTEPAVVRRSKLRMALSALRALSIKVLDDVRAGGSKGVQKFAENQVVAGLSAGGAYILALAAGLPAEFGFLTAVMAYVNYIAGKP